MTARQPHSDGYCHDPDARPGDPAVVVCACFNHQQYGVCLSNLYQCSMHVSACVQCECVFDLKDWFD